MLLYSSLVAIIAGKLK